MAKRKDVLNAGLKALVKGAEASPWIKIPTAFVSELAALSDDKQEALAGLSQEQFNDLLNQTKLATHNSVAAAYRDRADKRAYKRII